MNVDLVPAGRDDEATIERLLELYLHDFSELIGIQVKEDGRFGYPYLPSYWSDPGRSPFLIRADGRLAGFALIQTGSEINDEPDVLDVAEFFVLRGYRRGGVGTAAARQVFGAFAGTWEVRVLKENTPAQPFWAQAVAGFTREFDEFWHKGENREMLVFRFQSPA